MVSEDSSDSKNFLPSIRELATRLEVAAFEMESVASYAQAFECEIRRMRALEAFLKLKPPYFKGGPDPLEAETWLNSVKAMFDRIEVLPEYRVGFAAYLFEAVAEEWWEERHLNTVTYSEHMRWKRFELLFRRMYCKPPDWDPKTRFLNMFQDNKTVSEFTAEFEAALRGCASSMQADLELKQTKFMTGLKKKISMHIRPFSVTDFETLVEVALGVEADLRHRVRVASLRPAVRSACCILCGSEDSKMCPCPSRQLEEMTVAQYRSEFVEYYRSPTRNVEAGRVLMSIRFRRGLFHPIQRLLKLSKTFHDFDTLVAAAESAEASIEQRKNWNEEQEQEEERRLQEEKEQKKKIEEQRIARRRQEREDHRKKKEEQRVERLKREQEEHKKRKEEQRVERQRQEEEEQRRASQKMEEEMWKKHLEMLK